MERPSEQPAQGFGLMANGASRLWDVAVDESLEREGEWLLELDGPAVYLVFPLRDLAVIPEAISFLQRALNASPAVKGPRRVEDGDSLTLGAFSTSPVTMLRDDESPPRCFLMTGADAISTMRVTLQRDDVEMLLQALHQVAAQLSEEIK